MLSKSKLLSYRQCHKRLWLEKYRPELREVSDAAEASFARGHAVGDVARSIYGPGELLADGPKLDIPEMLKRTQQLAQGRNGTVYEAAFSFDEVLVLADVVKLSAQGASVIEVKSSTGVKDYYIDDCATQAHVMEGAGMPVRSISLAHIDKTFVYPGDHRYEGLLKEVDVGPPVAAKRTAVPQWIKGAKAVLGGGEPEIPPGAHCSDPFVCPFYGHCNEQTTEFPVTLLPRLSRRKAEDFRARGIHDVRDIPDGELDNAVHARVREATLRGVADVQPTHAEAVTRLAFPRFYLDFETINMAVPIWAGTRPYQQLPFQWSMHVEHLGGRLEHVEFLDVSGANPIQHCMTQLLEVLGSAGPIIVYSAFERRVIGDMAAMLPALADKLAALLPRLYDILPVIRAAYYHPSMRGSWSIKAVLPAIAPDLSYQNLGEVQDGGGAQAAFMEAVDPRTGATRRSELRDALLAYCRQDSLAMVRVAAFLADIGRGARC